MTTLAAALNSSAQQLRVDAAVADPADFYKIDSEVVQLLSHRQASAAYLAGDPTLWRVERGVAGTTAASHLSGATLTALYPQIALSPVESGGVSVEVPPAAPVAVTNIIAPGASIAGGEATLVGFALVGLAGLTGVQLVDGDNAFHAISLVSIFDPAGYFDATTPDTGTPGFVVPAGQGGIHRATLAVQCIDAVGSPPANWRIYVAIGFTSLGDASDTHVFGADNVPGSRFSMVASFCGQLDAGENLYFYVKCDDGGVGALNLYPATYASIERLTS